MGRFRLSAEEAWEMNAIAIGAHPDDVEFMCAGTLFLLKEAGFDCHVVAMAAGDCGSAEYPPEKIMRIRHGEAKQAAAVLGATYRCLDERDCRIFTCSATLNKAVEAIRAAGADVVFTHFPQDYMVDHEETSRIVRSAVFNVTMPNFTTGAESPAPILASMPHLYYWAPMEGIDIFGNRAQCQFYVDISDVMEKKVQMLACHKSQRNWLLKQHGVDEYINAMKENARKTGERAGVTYAEGFTQHRGHAYHKSNVLAKYVSVIEM